MRWLFGGNRVKRKEVLHREEWCVWEFVYHIDEVMRKVASIKRNRSNLCDDMKQDQPR